MHLVFVTSIVPDGTLTTGYEIANAAIIEALQRAGVSVSVLGFSWPGRRPSAPATTQVLGEVNVETASSSRGQKLRWLARAVAEGQTFSSVKLRQPGEDGIREALAALEPYDGYVLNGVQMAGAFPHLFKDRPSIFVAHNVEHRSAAENAAAATSIAERLLYTREARLLKVLEADFCRDAVFTFTLADEDRRALGVDGDHRSAMLPLTTRASAPARQPRETTVDFGLIGTWTWQPNRIGLDWFLNEVTPHLPDDVSIAIAGRLPAGVNATHPGVSFVGRVDDATDFIRSTRVVPLISRAGSGVQLKTIETFELGLPAVATRRSLRGVDYLPENCLVADDPKIFAQAMMEALDGSVGDADGRAFHRAQRTAMDRQMLRGLASLGFQPQRVAA